MKLQTQEKDTAIDERKIDPDEIKERYKLLQKEHNGSIRARNAAEQLGISEAQLLAAQLGDGATALQASPEKIEAILKSIEELGEVMALTRNDHCVHERHGVYSNFEMVEPKMQQAIFLNPDIDLRLFLRHWSFAFALREHSHAKERTSLQFFDKSGTAVHKIYLTEKSDASGYAKLQESFCNPKQERSLALKHYEAKEPELPDEDIDWAALREAWENLKDTHDFFMMLGRFHVGRQQALRKIGHDLAYPVSVCAHRQVLELACSKACEIMAFVGNRGCLQIHTGPVRNLKAAGPWYNVLDPKFNLHIKEDEIANIWITKKPTVDGIVSALELYNKSNELILTLFGKRKPGTPELSLWREILAAVPKAS